MPLGPGAAQAVEARPPRFLRVPRSLRSRVWYVCPAPLQPGPSTQSEKPTRPSTSQDIGHKDLWFRYISVRPYTTPRHWVPLPESPSYPIMISCPRLPWGSPGLPPLTTWSTSALSSPKFDAQTHHHAQQDKKNSKEPHSSSFRGNWDP